MDTTLLVLWPRLHTALTLGSFDTGVEIGGYVRDRRGSAYGLTGRRRVGARVENSSLEFDMQQKLGRAVLQGAFKLFWPDHPAQSDNLSLLPTGGCEVYYRDECFVGLRVAHDPRPDTGTTFRITNRLASGRRRLEVALAPRTDGVLNFGLLGRYGAFFAGFGKEDDYDFTDLDRRVYFFGFQYELRPPE